MVNVVKAGVKTAPTVFEDIITSMTKLMEAEIQKEQLNLHSKNHESAVHSDPEGTKKKLWSIINSNLGRAISRG